MITYGYIDQNGDFKKGHRDMRCGTFLCWAFGHKFVFKQVTFEGQTVMVETLKPMDYCIRCGIDKPSPMQELNTQPGKEI